MRVMLVLDNVIGQLTSHACVSGQNASCARVVVSHFAELIHCNFFFYENVSPMSSLSQGEQRGILLAK